MIISENGEMREQLIDSWRVAGWSVAVYSPSRFVKMREARSLFVQHIKREGIIVADRGNWLRYQLNKAKPKATYLEDAVKSVYLAVPVERFSADGRVEDNLIAADLAFSSVRNFGICYLANQNRLSFDYREIVLNLKGDFGLSRRQTELLLSLRPGKVAYRQGVECQIFSETVGEVRTLLSKFFENRPLKQIDAFHPLRRGGGGYPMLRDLEARVIMRLGRRPTEMDLSSLGLKEVWRWVRSPREYSWSIRRLSVRGVDTWPEGEALLQRQALYGDSRTIA